MQKGDVFGSRIFKYLLVLFSVALLLEIFLFNCNFWTTQSGEPVVLAENVVVKRPHQKISFDNLDIDAKTFYLEIQDGTAVYTCQITDAGNSINYPIPKNGPGVFCSSSITEPYRLHTYGNLKSIEFTFEDLEGISFENSYPFEISSISLNAPLSFSFNLIRFLVILGIGCAIWVFRPSSSIYSLRILERKTLVRAIFACLIIVLATLSAAGVLAQPVSAHIATPIHNAENWKGEELVEDVAPIPSVSTQYAELARAFAKGKVSLEDTPPDYLLEMDNPYDCDLRQKIEKRNNGSISTERWDTAYYDGAYYVYFGVVPVLIFYLPYYLLFGSDFPTAIGLIISLAAILAGLAFLLYRIAALWFKKTSLGTMILVYVGVVASSYLVLTVTTPKLYYLPIVVGLAFALWGGYFALTAIRSPKKVVFFALSAFCYALVLGCRPQLIVSALVIMPLVLYELIKQSRTETQTINRKAWIKWGVAFAVPIIIVVIALGWYNAIRFGSPFDFGANYNLTNNDMAKRGFNNDRSIIALFSYFLQPVAVSPVFPFLEKIPIITGYMGKDIYREIYGGIFAALPFLWSMIAVFFTEKSPRRTRIILILLALLLLALIVGVFDAQAAGLLERYFLDFGYLLAFGAAVAFFFLESQAKQLVPLRVFLFASVCLALFYGLLLYATGVELPLYIKNFDLFVSMQSFFQFWM